MNFGRPRVVNHSLYLSICIRFHIFKRRVDDYWLDPVLDAVEQRLGKVSIVSDRDRRRSPSPAAQG